MATKILFYHDCAVCITRCKDTAGDMSTAFEATGPNGLVVADGFYNRKMTDDEILRELDTALADLAAYQSQ